MTSHALTGKSTRRIVQLAHWRWRVFVLLTIIVLALLVRGLTAYFIHEHIYDLAWFQLGTYAHFDRQAQNILDHKASLFLIDDPSRTETAIYPPGYPIWVAFVYKVTGQRLATTVQAFQWVLDAWAVLLVVAISVVAFSWRVGLIAGFLAALSPLLALYGATPLADAPTSWFVLAGVLMLVLSVKRRSLVLALTAGALAGASCWLRANAVLLPGFWAMALMAIAVPWRQRITLAAAVVVGAVVVVSPLLLRNAMAFRAFTPTGLGAGTNLWEGIGETERAAEFGAVYGDEALLEQERIANGLPADAPFSLYWPNGVERDRERARKAMKVILAHPVWYAGVMLRRMAGTLKYAGAPGRYYGSAGINVTPKKVLPENLRGGIVAFVVTVLGMIQSLSRYLALPLMGLGIYLALKRDWRFTLIVLSTVLYYLIVGSALHTEIRYGLPMHALLVVFAGAGVSELYAFGVRRHRVNLGLGELSN